METYLHAIGIALPQNRVSNDDLAECMDTTDEWIRSRTGIRYRYMTQDESHTDLATRASLEAFASTTMLPQELTHVIGATCSPDSYSPSLAVSVAHNLQPHTVAAFDMNAMCSGYIYGLEVARGLLHTREQASILLLASELMSRRINMDDRTTAVLFGDASTATLLSSQSEGALALVEDTLTASDGTLSQCLTIGGACSHRRSVGDTITEDFFLQMNGREVFKNAVRIMPVICETILQKNNYSINDIDLLIAHQANFRIIDAVRERLGLSPEKAFMNVQSYGNTSAASIPLALAEAYQRGVIKKNMKVLLTAFGGGFTWGSAILQF